MRQYIRQIPFFICGLCAFASGIKQLREPDVWWQLLAGRWMLQHGQITRTDVFSYTMAGHRWINVKWLYEILIASLEKLTGPMGVMLLQSIVSTLIIYLLFKTVKLFQQHTRLQASGFSVVLSALLFLAIVEYRMAGRPEMVSHFFCTLYLFILWRYPGMAWRRIWLLIPLQCLWANMHEGYPVGLVITGMFAAGNICSWLLRKDDATRAQAVRAIWLFAACVLVVLLNPNGITLWTQPFEIYRQVWANKYTTELYSFRNPEYWTMQAKWHMVLLAAVIIFWIFRLRAWLRQKNELLTEPAIITYLLLIPLFGYLSLTANRNIPFAQIVLFPSVAAMLTQLAAVIKINKWPVFGLLGRRWRWVAGSVGALFYVSIVSNAFYRYTQSENRYGYHISMLHNPTGAAAFLKKYNIKGIAFSDYFVSSYLLWDLYPDFKSYIDLRDLDVFSTDFFDKYFGMYNHPAKFFEADSIYHFNYAVISTSQLIGLQQKLYWEPGYNMIYADPVAAIFLKQNDANKLLNNNFQIQKPFTWPQPSDDPAWAATVTKILNPFVSYDNEDPVNAPFYAALFYNQMGDYPTAINMLLPHLSDFQDNKAAFTTLANSYMQYSRATKDPVLQQKRADSARIYMEQAEALK